MENHLIELNEAKIILDILQNKMDSFDINTNGSVTELVKKTQLFKDTKKLFLEANSNYYKLKSIGAEKFNKKDFV